MENFDFSGWATRANLKCSDGRTIMPDAFKHNDGDTVPLVWNHRYDDPDKVIGRALLVNKPEGVYMYGTFNDTETAKNAKLLIQHGDINALSIYANQLQQSMNNVTHGNIREVSLVLAGSNPGAFIDTVMMHGEECEDECIIYTGEVLELYHNDEKEAAKMATEEKTIGDVFETLTEEQKNAVYAIIGAALENEEDKNKDNNKENNKDNNKDKNDDSEGGSTMKHNVFENDEGNNDVLIHDAMNTIIADAKRYGTMKESFLAHADEYGIEQIDYLFPEAKALNNAPEFVKRAPSEWVGVVMSGVHRTPFSRIKSVFADITADEARAKGYVKGNLKMEEVFGLLKRTTEPTTIYKKQKLDRDDISDINDFDVVSWLKTEMRMMLDEEIARAIVFGDKRTSINPDKIAEDKIRPIISDTDFYTIKTIVSPESGESLEHAIVTSVVKAQDDYQGSGNLTAFLKKGVVTSMLLMEDAQGHRLYKNLNDLALAMNVSKIVPVPASIVPDHYYGVIVDLKDYNVGADKGGSINMFDDFDIDYNQMKYLIETRCSGALTKPYSAIALKDNV